MPSLRSLFLVIAMCLSLSLALESYKAEDGYEVFPSLNESRYKLNPVPQTWTEALTLCQVDGGGSHLVIPNSQEEADIIQKLVDRITDPLVPNVFVGASDIVTEGTWTTIEGGLVSTSGFNSWSPNEPNGGKNENCGGFGRNGKYGDLGCALTRPFVCEKPNA